MEVSVKITSNRKRKARKFKNERHIARYLKRRLTLETRQPAKAYVQRRVSASYELKEKYALERDHQKVYVRVRPAQGHLVFTMQLPGFEPITQDEFVKIVRDNAKNGRLTELPNGFLWALGEAAGEVSEVESSRMRQAQTRVAQISGKLHSFVRGLVESDRPYRKAVRKVVGTVLKDLSLADV